MEFVTLDGRSIPAISAAQMREVDRIAVEELGPNLYQMMENAGRNLAEEALARLDGNDGPVLALAGSGGNGGGVICAARHLANHGLDVRLALAGAEERLGEVPRAQLGVMRAAGAAEIPSTEIDRERPSLILDGLIGYSLRGPPRDPIATIIAWINAQTAMVIALDLPSGLDATHGSPPGACVQADVTVTLALPKTGLAHPNVGELVLADLGIPAAVFDRAGIAYRSPFAGSYRLRLRAAVTPT
jgi:NAD(P)H-hydrate epimerase